MKKISIKIFSEKKRKFQQQLDKNINVYKPKEAKLLKQQVQN